MTHAYSQDLRERVVAFVQDGGRREDAAKVFSVGLATVHRWMSLLRKNGHVLPAPRKAYTPSKIEEKALMSQLEERPDATLKEIAAALGVTDVGVFYACRRYKLTRKKNATLPGARRRKTARIFAGT